MSNLSETRKADRAFMMKEVVKLAAYYGVEVDDQYESTNREIGATFRAPGGLCLHHDFNGGSWQPNVYVLGWHMSGDYPDHKLNLNFAPGIGNVNPYHQRKATSICYGFDELMTELDRCWKLCKSGEAYEEQACK